MDFTRSNKFNSVYVVESLPDCDLKTGRDLFENCIFPLGQINKYLHTNLYQPFKKCEFLGVLKKIKSDCYKSSRSPILHIEVHANDNGISVGSGEFITWSEIKHFLCDINKISGLNLLVIMAACNGINLAKVISPTDRAPVWGIIGPSKVIKAGRIYEGFKEFYSELLESFDGRKAINKLNNSPEIKDWEFKFFNAEFFFLEVYKYYLKYLCTDDSILNRAKKIFKQVSGGRKFQPTDEKREIDKICNILKSKPEPFFNKYKERFFMIDIIKGNDKRFNITFEQCNICLQGKNY